MKRKKIACLLVVAMLTTSIFITKPNNVYATDSKVQAQEIVSKMTLDEKIGQMIMPDFRQWQAEGEASLTDMTVLNDEIAQIIDKYDLGGVILFANNVKETAQTTKLVHDLQQVAINDEDGNLPLLLTIDQEGGIVTRLGTGTNLPGNMALGATRSEENAYNSGYVIGRELNALGLNVNFGPVMDVNNNPSNPVIHLRSISSNPELVGTLGSQIMKGIQDQGVATALKHFPGHGDTATDSHYGLPVVNKSLDQLMNVELKPFKAGIDNGTDMVMTAHIQYPQIEKDTATSKKDGSQIVYPATLSDDVITGVLRNKLGFNGVVITDALNMTAISENFGEVDAVLETFKAGVDIALMPTIIRSKADVQKLDAIISAVKEAVESGEISIDRINESATRVVKLKIDRGILDIENDTRTLEEKIANANTIVGSKENRDIEREVSGDAITIVKNENHILPLKPQENENILLVAPYDNELPGMRFGINRLVQEGKLNKVNLTSLSYNKQTELSDSAKASIDAANKIIIISEISSPKHLASTHWLTKYPTELFNYAKAQGKEVVLASVGHPYDVTARDEAAAKVIAYGYKGMDPTEADGGLSPVKAFGPNIPAIMDVVFGAHEAVGTLPVDIPELDLTNPDTPVYGTTNKYNYGYGILNLTSMGTTTISAPAEAKTGSEFIANISLSSVDEAVSVRNYTAVINYNPEALEFIKADVSDKDTRVSDVDVENGKLTIEVLAEGESVIVEDSINLTFKVKSESGDEVIKVESLSLVDKYERVFNASSSEVNVTIKSNSKPVITASDVEITKGTKFDPLKNVTATDKEDGDLTSKLVVKSNNVNTSKAGTYSVTYSVEDSDKNTETLTIKVLVKEKSNTGKPGNSANNSNNGNNNSSNKPNGGKNPSGKLPNTGGVSSVGITLIGSIIAAIGTIIRKKK